MVDKIKKTGNLFVVSAPSGAGKTTLVEKALKAYPRAVRSVSMTTRLPRPGEKNGRDYNFVTEKKFRQIINNSGFLEYAKVFNHYYGTPKKFVEANIKKNKDVVLTIDVQGAMKIKNKLKNKAVFVFIVAPGFNELKKRLQKRKTDSSQEIKYRLKIARQEMAYLKNYDYKIVNDNVKTAYKQLLSIFIAERCKVSQ
jgi:guanylate kinase